MSYRVAFPNSGLGFREALFLLAFLVVVIGVTEMGNTGETAPQSEPWVSQKGLDVFMMDLTCPFAPVNWDLDQWDTMLDALAFMKIRLLQVPRSRWGNRPPETEEEWKQAEFWKSVLNLAKSKGFRTAVVYGTTFHGSPEQSWYIYSPNNPDHENWKQLVKDYEFYAKFYGKAVDEWHSVDDPGGCAVCSGHSGWRGKVTLDCNPSNPCCTVGDFVGLVNAQRNAVMKYNPDGVVVAHTWSLKGWWGKSPDYETHLDEFVDTMAEVPKDIIVSTHGWEDEITDKLQDTKRELQAWCFYLFDHEFTYGITRVHFEWMHEYLSRIKNQGFETTIPHTPYPTLMLPALYTYSVLTDDLDRTFESIMLEFSQLLVDGAESREALASALVNLASFYDTILGVANWDLEKLKPIEDSPPYGKRYSDTQLAYLKDALEAIEQVKSPKSEPGIPMLIPPEEWIGILHEQILALYNAGHMDERLQGPDRWLEEHRPRVAELPSPITRSMAEKILNDYRSVDPAQEAMKQLEAYLLRFWREPSKANPLGMIYIYLDGVVQQAGRGQGSVSIQGDVLEYRAPSHEPLFIRIEQ